jgi:short-subunit dehydrogenase
LLSGLAPVLPGLGTGVPLAVLGLYCSRDPEGPAMTVFDQANPKLAVVTGASTGIGFEIAAALAERGFDLILTSLNTQRLANSADLLIRRHPRASITPVAADLTRERGAQTLYESVARDRRSIDVLVNNAGVGVWGAFADHPTLRRELAMIQLNAVAVVQVTKKFLPAMIERRSGRLLFTTSVGALTPMPLASVYCATKAFVYSFAESLRDELKGTGITVTALLPGPTATNWFERAGAGLTHGAQGSLADPADVATAGVDAMMRGADHVFTPLANRAVRRDEGHLSVAGGPSAGARLRVVSVR